MAMPLAQFFTIRPENKRKMSKLRDFFLKSAIKKDLLGSIANMIIASNNMGNTSVDIINYHREVISGETIASQQNKIFQVFVLHGNVPVNEIIKFGDSFGH